MYYFILFTLLFKDYTAVIDLVSGVYLTVFAIYIALVTSAGAGACACDTAYFATFLAASFPFSTASFATFPAASFPFSTIPFSDSTCGATFSAAFASAGACDDTAFPTLIARLTGGGAANNATLSAKLALVPPYFIFKYFDLYFKYFCL